MKVWLLSLTLLSSVAWAKGENFLPPTFSTDFEQIQKSALSGKEKKSLGHIEYKFPSHIRFEVQKPDVIIFVSNPEMTWYYTAPFVQGEPGEVTVRPTGKLALAKFFDALKNGLQSNELYSVAEKAGKVELQFNKKSQKELGITKALLSLGEKKDFTNLKSMELEKTDKAKVLLNFSNMKIGADIKKERFIFVAPPNTRSAQ